MLNWNEILLRLALASIFGGMVGIERERKNWTAGLRTHMMVCVGSALTMMVSSFGFSDVLGKPGVTLDPSRVAAQVISGIGFIGAGTILFLRQEVIRGLTTASGLWTVAAIGLATGGGMYFAAASTTILAIIILSILKPLGNKFFRRYKQQAIKIHAAVNEQLLPLVYMSFKENSLAVANLSVENKGGDTVITVRFINRQKDDLMVNVMATLQKIPAVKEMSWNNAPR